jgi:hypothetical protein
LLGSKCISIKLVSTVSHNFKFLGVFNHLIDDIELQKFHTLSHQYLNTSFHLETITLSRGQTSVQSSNDDSTEITCCRSIILITDKNTKMTGTLITKNFNMHINLIETPHIERNDKIIFLITNSINNKKNSIYNYQPCGTINTNNFKFILNSSYDSILKIIYQKYDILTMI